MGKWLTPPPPPPPHTCSLSNIMTARLPGAIWQCECGEKWRYEGYTYDEYAGRTASWTNLRKEVEQNKRAEERRARKARVPWFMRPFIR